MAGAIYGSTSVDTWFLSFEV
ncbi:hypothetical protein CCACVL1_05108 [Corchorus capsularis]|uniref:Uncharacterized protein n=1 Tax=Corchorus capsularis TaxID=210143 RepID=A0A1R3JMF6_COCAP|nr:hypothetical protein CCACVL1_05108 [Corchorus capsularis]